MADWLWRPAVVTAGHRQAPWSMRRESKRSRWSGVLGRLPVGTPSHGEAFRWGRQWNKPMYFRSKSRNENKPFISFRFTRSFSLQGGVRGN